MALNRPGLRVKYRIMLLAAPAAMLIGSAAQADKQDRAIRECKRSISDAYGVSKFRNVFAEPVGHDRFRVYGKIKARGNRYPFSCRVKRGWVQSYSYAGPHNRYDHDYYEDEHKTRNIAIGVGLAALAAAAIAASSGSQANDTETESPESGSGHDKTKPGHNLDKNHLEDECGEELGGRIRREHDGVHRIAFNQSQIEGNGSRLSGSGYIQWQQHQPSALEFSCSFDSSGRVTDSSYSFY